MGANKLIEISLSCHLGIQLQVWSVYHHLGYERVYLWQIHPFISKVTIYSAGNRCTIFTTSGHGRWCCRSIPANTKHLYNICSTSAQRLCRWSNIVQMLYKCVCWDRLILCKGSNSLLVVRDAPFDIWGGGGLEKKSQKKSQKKKVCWKCGQKKKFVVEIYEKYADQKKHQMVT